MCVLVECVYIRKLLTKVVQVPLESLSTAGNQANFLALLKQLATSDALLRQHLNAPLLKTATYLSPQQHKLTQVLGKHQILKAIIEEVRTALASGYARSAIGDDTDNSVAIAQGEQAYKIRPMIQFIVAAW